MRIVCFGDSLTACGGPGGRYSDILQDRFPDHRFLNRGVGGNTFVDGRERLREDLLDLAPDVVLLELGACDWWQDERPPAAWAADLEEFVDHCQAIGAVVVILGVFGNWRDDAGNRHEKTYGYDARAGEYRALEAEIAARRGCPYIANIQQDIVGRRCCWGDRNHPNEYGNRHVADAIEPVLATVLRDAPQPVRRPVLRTTRDFWEEAVALGGDRLAVVDGARRLTYDQADAEVQRLAAGLVAATGVNRPTVAVWLENCLDYYLLYWAIVRLGGVIVPLNVWLKPENIAAIFANVRPDALVVRRRAGCPALDVPADVLPPTVRVVAEDGLPLADTVPPRPPLTGEDLAIVMHTSGTTAAPKGAMMRHADLMFNVMVTVNAQRFTREDVHLLVNPMFHCTALYSQLPAAAYQQTPLVITAATDAPGLMRLVENERITTFMSIPPIFQRIVDLPDLASYDHSSLRVCAYAGSTMPVSTIHQLQAAFPEVDLRNFFGLTETISATHVLSGADAEERPDSIGRLLPFVDAMVVDEANRPCAPGEVGELLFARDNVVPGYFNDPDRLNTALDEVDGRTWFRTGDLASVDDEGYFFIKGRQKDMIIVGGENVYAAEVEAVLMAHDGVREAAVKGVPATGVRAQLGELIKAYVVPRGDGFDERDLRRHCHARLASFKIPHFFVILDALPRNPAGKVVKAELPD